MDRRYQVFVSSTFEDLEDARKEVSMALLKSDCFPAGMELFPAADSEQFEYIKQVITDSDYFVIVTAGKYGSIHPETGLSYTEMEYDFALEIGKPIVRLIHRDPFKILPGRAIEQTDNGRKMLGSFREKLKKSRLANFWDDPKMLGQQTVLALLDMKKRHPSVGWVRGSNAITVELLQELETLRKTANASIPSKTETLVGFKDLTAQTEISIKVASAEDLETGNVAGVAQIDNDAIASAIFMSLISNSKVLDIGQAASDLLTDAYQFAKKYHKYEHIWLEISYEITEHFLHYLEARGLVRGTTSSSFGSSWQLTPRGRLHATSMSSRRYIK